MLLIGSRSIKHHFPDFSREPVDTDYATDLEDHTSLEKSPTIEYLYNPIIGNLTGIATPDTIYTLKISHCIGWNIKWEKHMYDIQFLKAKGCKIIYPLIYDLYNFWNETHLPNFRSNLKLSSDKFFDNSLVLDYTHDYIHTLIIPVPTYTKVLKDGEEVDVSEDKFNSLSFDEKLSLVREEVYVMAWERYKSQKYRTAYSIMLKKFIL
jgi:hypothetical protein